MENCPELRTDVWTVRRLLQCSRFSEQVIMCCPEDITCESLHAPHELHPCCRIPLCWECYFTSTKSTADLCKIPRCLANDNFYGRTDEELIKYRVRWIECAAASPILTCLIAYYVEGDRGHLMDERVFQRTDPLVVRGNAYSFQMPWEKISKNRCIAQ